MRIALESSIHRSRGTLWRVVEHQYAASTRKIVDTLDEQAILEDILEISKPPYPPGCDDLHYLLKTPFRYDPPEPNGSRFRRVGSSDGVFYASYQVRTALAEIAYHRVRFFRASVGTPWPRSEEPLTVFSLHFATRKLIDLTKPPLDTHEKKWTDPENYTATQQLADDARAAGVEVIRYRSVRDPESGLNAALLTPRAFASKAPVEEQTWFLRLGEREVQCISGHVINPQAWTFAHQD